MRKAFTRTGLIVGGAVLGTVVFAGLERSQSAVQAQQAAEANKASSKIVVLQTRVQDTEDDLQTATKVNQELCTWQRAAINQIVAAKVKPVPALSRACQ